MISDDDGSGALKSISLWMAVDLLEYQQWWDTIRLSCSSDPVDLVAQAALPSKIQSMDTD
jgi:hypothetical protein